MNRINAASVRLLTVFFGVTSLISCTATSFSTQSPQPASLYKVDFLSSETANVLESATVGQSFVMPAGPLPFAAQVQVVDQYFAASGRRCFSVMLETAQNTEPMLFCRYGPEQWGASRALPKTLKPAL